MQRRMSRVIVYVASLFLFWLIAAPYAYAYIDPGSSSFIIQILIGAAAGGALAIATFWRRIRAFLKRVFGKGAEEASAPASPAAPPPASVPSPPVQAAPPVQPVPPVDTPPVTGPADQQDAT